MIFNLVLTGVQVTLPIGVTLPERQTVSTLALDLEALVDHPDCGKLDQVEAVVDYAAVVESLRNVARGFDSGGVLTLEYLAARMAEVLQEKFPLPSGKLVLHKNNRHTKAIAQDVAISVSWQA